MARKKTKGTSALKKITTRAKQLYKQGGSWKSAIKKAGAEYRGKKRKVSGVRTKKTHHKKTRHKRLGATREIGKDRLDNKRVNITVGSITAAQAKSVIRSRTKDSLATALLQRDMARTKTAKRKISKKITSLRSTLHRFE
jgi:hypothetical protein